MEVYIPFTSLTKSVYLLGLAPTLTPKLGPQCNFTRGITHRNIQWFLHVGSAQPLEEVEVIAIQP